MDANAMFNHYALKRAASQRNAQSDATYIQVWVETFHSYRAQRALIQE